MECLDWFYQHTMEQYFCVAATPFLNPDVFSVLVENNMQFIKAARNVGKTGKGNKRSMGTRSIVNGCSYCKWLN